MHNIFGRSAVILTIGIISVAIYYQVKKYQLIHNVYKPTLSHTLLSHTADGKEKKFTYYRNQYLGINCTATKLFEDYSKDGKYLVDLMKKDYVTLPEIIKVFKLKQKFDLERDEPLDYKDNHDKYDFQEIEDKILASNLDDQAMKRFYISCFFDVLSRNFELNLDYNKVYRPDHHLPGLVYNQSSECYKVIFWQRSYYCQKLIVGGKTLHYYYENFDPLKIDIPKNQVKDNYIEAILHSDIFGYKKRMSLDLPVDKF